MDHNQVPYPFSVITLVIGFGVGILNSMRILAQSISPLSMENIVQSVILSLICTVAVFLANSVLKWTQKNYKAWVDKYFHIIWRRKKG